MCTQYARVAYEIHHARETVRPSRFVSRQKIIARRPCRKYTYGLVNFVVPTWVRIQEEINIYPVCFSKFRENTSLWRKQD
jgi:hypothetical protein